MSKVKAELTKKPEISRKTEKEKQFCLNCGAELLPKSKF